MALKNVIGIDHAVVMVKDLDKAAENYKRLGFTVSPRGTHSAHMGSGNYTIMFDPDYMELLGVLTPTEHNAPARAHLEKNGEGIERIAFTAVDSALGAEEIRARGYPPIGPTDFERPVTTSEEMAFRVLNRKCGLSCSRSAVSCAVWARLRASASWSSRSRIAAWVWRMT